MNGVLAKPFTKEGMLKSVKTHMSHLLKNPPPQDPSASAGYFMGAVPYMASTSHMGSGNSMKYENSTPPAGSTWSPGIPQVSPMNNGVDQSYLLNGSNQYHNLTPGGSRPPNYPAKMESPTGRMSDHESPPGKRQRLNTGHGYS